MLKKQIFLIVLVCLMFLTIGCSRKTKKVEDFPSLVNKMESYKVTGKLYSTFPTGTKESLITVYFKQPEKYRVEIDNSTNGDKQIILKNGDDVDIILPGINKSFKLKSGWPINSSYCYLLQSIAKDYVNCENKLIEESDDQTKVELQVKLFDNASVTKEIVIFNNDTGLPSEVQQYDDTNNLLTRFVYLNIEENPKLDDALFKKNETQTSSVEIFNSVEYQREKTYPTYYPLNTTLKEEKTFKTGDVLTYMMTYTGDLNYTIIEQEVMKEEKAVTSFLEGDIYLLADSVSVINKNCLTFFQGGMEYILASNEVNMYELIKMAYSLTIDYEK